MKRKGVIEARAADYMRTPRSVAQADRERNSRGNSNAAVILRSFLPSSVINWRSASPPLPRISNRDRSDGDLMNPRDPSAARTIYIVNMIFLFIKPDRPGRADEAGASERPRLVNGILQRRAFGIEIINRGVRTASAACNGSR